MDPVGRAASSPRRAGDVTDTIGRAALTDARSPPTLKSEQVDELIRRIPVAVCVNAAIGLATYWVLARAAGSREQPLAWLACLFAALAGRLVIWQLDRRVALQADTRALLSTVGSTTTGLVWGVGAALLMPDDPTYMLFVTFAVGGMCAGSVTYSAAHLPSLGGFVLAACVPLAAGLFAQGSDTGIAMGVMTLVYAAALLFTGNAFSVSFKEQIVLQRELNAANRRLRDEMAQHQATEDRLRQSQKLDAIGQLTAGIAHDFNNLLMVISGHTDALVSRGLPPDVDRRVAAIRDAAARGSQLTRQLLAFGRRQRLQPRVVDLDVLVGEIARLLGRTLGRRIAVEFKPGEGLWPVFVDPGQIEHALLNLAINARDAMPDGGTITIATDNVDTPQEAAARDLPAGPYVRTRVRDTGAGMTPEVLARAVEPFFTTKMPGQGSGLGLSQVHGLVHQSGGTLVIHSAPGQGTTVEIYLPRAPAASARAAP